MQIVPLKRGGVSLQFLESEIDTVLAPYVAPLPEGFDMYQDIRKSMVSGIGKLSTQFTKEDIVATMPIWENQLDALIILGVFPTAVELSEAIDPNLLKSIAQDLRIHLKEQTCWNVIHKYN